MNRMSDMLTESALMELLHGPGRRSPGGRAPSSSDAACPEAAGSGCDDPLAPHDLAALREGRLSPGDIHRLAGHVARCTTCKILVATIVAEVTRAESTRTVAVAGQRGQ